jgi:uncharacterized protein YndB with AHSA1/START domain
MADADGPATGKRKTRRRRPGAKPGSAQVAGGGVPGQHAPGKPKRPRRRRRAAAPAGPAPTGSDLARAAGRIAAAGAATGVRTAAGMAKTAVGVAANAAGRAAGMAVGAAGMAAGAAGKTARMVAGAAAGAAKRDGVSNEAVKKATGRTWDQWFRLLDQAGAANMPHKAIAALIGDRFGVPGEWWAQMVTVAYEQARDLRQAQQRSQGYAATVSRTISASIDQLYEAWFGNALARWLPDTKFTVSQALPEKSMRITWPDGTHVDVEFHEQGEGKATVSVQHAALPSKDAVESAKALWNESLERLKSMLELR